MRIIDADNFYENLVEQAITDSDRKFCDKVKYALDKQKEIEIKLPYNSIGTWNVIGNEVGALGIKYAIKKCSRCGFEHSLIIPDNFCPKCGQKKVDISLDNILKKEV